MKRTLTFTLKTFLYALSVVLLPFVLLTSSVMLGYSIRRKNSHK